MQDEVTWDREPGIASLLQLICAALQQNREQVAQVYFEIWTIEVGIGWKITLLSILRFCLFTYLLKYVFYHLM